MTAITWGIFPGCGLVTVENVEHYVNVDPVKRKYN